LVDIQEDSTFAGEKISGEEMIKQKQFEDEYFLRVTKEIPDSERNKYKEIYAHSLSLINFLFVSGEKVVHYTKKAVAQKLLFDEKSKFRLNMATLSNDIKDGKTLCDYLGLENEYQRLQPEKEVYFLGDVILEPRYNENSKGEEFGAFIGCFSFNKDCLNQFRLYGKEDEKEGCGLSLTFWSDFFSLENKLTESSTDTHSSLYRCMYIDPETGRVVSVGHQEEYMHTKENSNEYKKAKLYPNPIFDKIPELKQEDEEYVKKIRDVVSNVQNELSILKEKIQVEGINKSIVFKLLINLRYLTKDVAFKEEQECRIVKILPLTNEQVKISEDYNKMFVEYLDVREFIKEVTFGPTATGIDLFQDILHKKGLKIQCAQSKLPLA
jgi:hypothetical protein